MQEYLAPYGEESPEFLGELERTVALLAFDRPGESPFADLFSPSHRNATASELNAALLASQCQEKEPRLPRLLKVRTPTRLAGLEPPDSPSSAHEPSEPPPPFARTSAPRQSRGAGRRPSSVLPPRSLADWLARPPGWVQMLVWAQQRLDGEQVGYPRIDLRTGQLSPNPALAAQNASGGGPGGEDTD